MLQVHDIVDRYVVEGVLGQGGMASVYAVCHRKLGIRRALKLLHSDDPALEARLIDEGRIQARLDPVHVVPVTDIVEVDGRPALIMPLVRGCTLAELLAHTRPTQDEILALLDGITRGVATAHRAGVVHRDLKPSNVLLELSHGRLVPRVSDFGVAKVLSAGAATTCVGTPRYAAPEQLDRGAPVDQRADLYALGLIWAELATGTVPDGPDDLEGVPDPWLRAVRGLLHHDPASRTPDIEHLRTQLDQLEPDVDCLSRPGPLQTAVEALRDAHMANAQTYLSDADASRPSIAPGAFLPAERDSFVGRRAELELLEQQLVPGRWLTVVGPGGVGKSRLVLHHIRRGSGPTGPRLWCDLDGISSAEGVAAEVAAALGIPAGRDPVRVVGHALAARGPIVVVLDDADLAMEQLARIVPRWLELASQAAFVATSRRTGGAREHVIQLDVLPCGDAVALFDARATAIHAAWAHDGDEGTVEALVQELDGLPLALELAAARVSVLSPAKLLDRLDQRFRLLAQAGRPERHATLRATLDASWALLDPAERATLAQLAVFEGGFDVEACEQVVDLSCAPGAPWVVDVLEALVHHSLVRRPARDRFELLASVRAYARDQEPDLTPAEARHGRWAAQIGSGAAVPAIEIRNLTIACQRAIDRRDVPTMLGCLMGCQEIRSSTGPLQEVLTLSQRCMEIASEPIDRAQVHFIQASTHRFLSDLDAAEASALAGLAALDGLEHSLQMSLEHTLAAIDQARGRLEEAHARFTALAEAVRETGQLKPLSSVLCALGLTCLRLGDLDAAAHHLDEAIDVDLPDHELLSALSNRGLVAEDRGRFDEARRWQERALRAAEASGNLWTTGVVHSNLANALYMLGEVDQAEAHYRSASQIHRRVGDRRSEAIPLANQAVIAMSRESWAEARDLLLRAIAIAEELQVLNLLPGFWQNLAKAQARCGDPSWSQSIDEAVALAKAPPARAKALCARALLSLEADRLDAVTGDLEAAEALGLLPAEAAFSSYTRALWLRAHDRHVEADEAVAEGDQRCGEPPAPHTSLAKLRRQATGEPL